MRELGGVIACEERLSGYWYFFSITCIFVNGLELKGRWGERLWMSSG
jgi:hypothetical protein